MTMEEYQAQLQEWQKREADAKAEIARLDQEIANLKQQIQETEQQTASVWNEIYAMLGTDLNNQLDGLMALSPEELFKRRKELDDLEAQLNELKESKIYALTEMQNLVASIEGKITQLRTGKSDIYGDPYQWVRIYSYNRDQIKDPDLIYPDQIFKIQREVGPDEYLVEKGDFLYKIAGKADVLGDPTLWTKLYEANKDIVGSDPSLIYPFQVLRIPR